MSSAGLVGVGAAAFVVVLLTAPQAAGWTAIAWLVAAVPALAGIGVVGWAVLERRGLAALSAGDTVEGAFEAQQRLLDDVRHELKTPITIVRGHLEMMDAADTDDVEAIRSLGMAELDRMTRLIGDIDVLAAVESGQISAGEVDLAALTQRVSEMVGVIGNHVWRVEQTADGVIRADGDRLLQAWVQLADNAAKYSPAGTAIEIGSAIHSAGAQLWVRDHGPASLPRCVTGSSAVSTAGSASVTSGVRSGPRDRRRDREGARRSLRGRRHSRRRCYVHPGDTDRHPGGVAVPDPRRRRAPAARGH